ncbi:MAG: hypothetical protein ONB48_10630 [candidate division KSB1 bacterium]|nr:hypothetical protein [candidate division KSB1 bacterium]MDZ7273943.1 hypothetical protein [candidate division KSB1 bacterium]MDZ7286099.1 hypothetical protein [candidate division KSB1 bacterium]MDZ7299131.1 hypothetical protein [candidate division KSB1 bacterium]MDZ7306678.1 hypothetical protein [candidate division KSB1 bacterium]
MSRSALIGKDYPASPPATGMGKHVRSGIARFANGVQERGGACQPRMAKLKVTYKMGKRFGIQAGTEQPAPVQVRVWNWRILLYLGVCPQQHQTGKRMPFQVMMPNSTGGRPFRFRAAQGEIRL